MFLNNIIYKINPNLLFLVDSLGALLSAFLLSQLLARFENVFGMPKNELYQLSIIASFFALYSLTCYLSKLENWKLYLKLIAIANLIYCIITIGMIIDQFYKITLLGLIYFALEITIIFTLAIFEFKVALK